MERLMYARSSTAGARLRLGRLRGSITSTHPSNASLVARPNRATKNRDCVAEKHQNIKALHNSIVLICM